MLLQSTAPATLILAVVVLSWSHPVAPVVVRAEYLKDSPTQMNAATNGPAGGTGTGQSATEAKVEFTVTYFVPRDPKPHSLTLHFDIPHLSSRLSAFASSPGGNSLRHGFRSSPMEKSSSAAGANGPYDSSVPRDEVSQQGGSMYHRGRGSTASYLKQGPLIHVVSMLQSGRSPNFTVSFSYDACVKPANRMRGLWIALVRGGGGCSPEDKLRNLMSLQSDMHGDPPDTIIVYGSSGFSPSASGSGGSSASNSAADLRSTHSESFLSVNHGQRSPMVILLPWRSISRVVRHCFNSTGKLSSQERDPKMSAGETQLFVTHSDDRGGASSTELCKISIKVHTSPDDNFLNKTSVLFVSVSFILLMVISLAWLMFYYVQRFRYIHTKEQFSRRLAHMAKKAVAKIPVKTLKHGDKETDPDVDNCAICIECYRPSDTVRILPCKHYFHKSCIDPWLLEQRSCPMCKLNILQAYGFLSAERGSLAASEEHLSSTAAEESVLAAAAVGSTGPADSLQLEALPATVVAVHSPLQHQPVPTLSQEQDEDDESSSPRQHRCSSLRLHHHHTLLSRQQLHHDDEGASFLPSKSLSMLPLSHNHGHDHDDISPLV